MSNDPSEYKELADELSALCKLQPQALQASAYKMMSAQEAQEYDARRIRIGELSERLGKFEAAKPIDSGARPVTCQRGLRRFDTERVTKRRLESSTAYARTLSMLAIQMLTEQAFRAENYLAFGIQNSRFDFRRMVIVSGVNMEEPSITA